MPRKWKWKPAKCKNSSDNSELVETGVEIYARNRRIKKPWIRLLAVNG
jgi:hypothetical protein